MPLIESILLLLVVSRIAGEIAERYRQPSMIGEIAAGILLGPSLLGLIAMTPQLKAISELGVLLLVFLAGMDMDLHDLRSAMQGKGIWVGIMGFLVPLALGMATGWLFGFDMTRNIFLGLCIAITALPVSVRILMDLGVLQTKLARQIISAAILNDVSALLMLGIILEMQQDSGNWKTFVQSASWILAKTLLFMGCILLASRFIRYSSGRIPLSRQWLNRSLAQLKGKEALFAVTLLFVLLFAGTSELVGLHFVVGAFFGSMLLSHQWLGAANFKEVQTTASRITMGFLGPLFFAAIGLEFNASTLSDWPLMVAVLVVSFVGKIAGGFLGGRLSGQSIPDSWALGIGLNGRGIMELVIASIALTNGFIDHKIFSILILMGTLTTFVTPLLLKAALRRSGTLHEQSRSADRAAQRDAMTKPWLPVPSVDANTINDPPIANPDRKSTRRDTALTFPSADLTANDIDPDGDALMVMAVMANDDTHGTVRLANDHVTYQPDRDFTGSATFGYIVSDHHGGTAIGTVHVRVIP
ncbi:MAG: cation:proton antiporter [Nitrospirota bacterium]|nr:cation:proton antiporter [Nitrospirota bacterium]